MPSLAGLLNRVRYLIYHPRPWRCLAQSVLIRTPWSERLLVDCDTFKIRCGQSALSVALWVDPSATDERLFVRRYCAPGETVVDIGANIGTFALEAAAAVGPTGQVWAVEAHPRQFRLLQRNLVLNDATQVTAYNYAVGAERAVVTFSDYAFDLMNAVGRGELRVTQTPLDRLLAGKAAHIDLLKLDVEGYEAAVLDGAAAVLARTDACFVEVSDEHAAHYGQTAESIVGRLRAAGFALYHEDLTPVPTPLVVPGVINVIALRPGTAFARRVLG